MHLCTNFKVSKCEQFHILKIKVSLNVSEIVYVRIKRFTGYLCI